MNEGTAITVVGALGIVLAAVFLIFLTWYVFNGQKTTRLLGHAQEANSFE